MTAVVAGLWRFPVKSMQGERADRLEVSESGVVGDRRYGVFTPDGSLLSAKTERRLLDAAARTEGDQVVIALPDGSEHAAPEATPALCAWLGRDVEVREAGVTPAAYRMTLDPPNDDAELYEIPTPPGSFVDLAAVHVLTASSLAAMASARPGQQWDVRRFRPNVLVEHPASGFPEDEWVGGQVRVGGAVLDVAMRTMRCAMPLRAQPAFDSGPELVSDREIYRSLEDVHANDLGVYCGVARPGVIAIGDPVGPVPAPTGG